MGFLRSILSAMRGGIGATRCGSGGTLSIARPRQKNHAAGKASRQRCGSRQVANHRDRNVHDESNRQGSSGFRRTTLKTTAALVDTARFRVMMSERPARLCRYRSAPSPR